MCKSAVQYIVHSTFTVELYENYASWSDGFLYHLTRHLRLINFSMTGAYSGIQPNRHVKPFVISTPVSDPQENEVKLFQLLLFQTTKWTDHQYFAVDICIGLQPNVV